MSIRILLAALTAWLIPTVLVACTDLKDPFSVPPPDPCAPNCGSTWNEYDPDTGEGTFVMKGFTTATAPADTSCGAAVGVDPRVVVMSVRLLGGNTGQPIAGLESFSLDSALSEELNKGGAGDSRFWAFTAHASETVKAGESARIEIGYKLSGPYGTTSRVVATRLVSASDFVTGRVDTERREFDHHVLLTRRTLTHICVSKRDSRTGECD